MNEFKKELEDPDVFDHELRDEQLSQLNCDKIPSKRKNTARKSTGAKRGSADEGLPAKKKRRTRVKPEPASQPPSQVSSEGSTSMELVSEFKKEIQDTDCALSEKHDKTLSEDKNSAQKSTGVYKSSAGNGLQVKKRRSQRSHPEPTTPSHSRVSSEDSASMEFVNEFKKEIQDTDGFDCAMQDKQLSQLSCTKTLSKDKNSARKSKGADESSTENGRLVKKKRSKRGQPVPAAPSHSRVSSDDDFM